MLAVGDQFRRWLPRGLLWQLAVLFALLFSVSIGLYAFYTAHTQGEHLSRQLEAQAVALSSGLAAAAANEVKRQNAAQIEQILLQARDFSDVLRIEAISTAGKPFASLSRHDDGVLRPDEAPRPVMPPGKLQTEVRLTDNPDISHKETLLEVWQPIVPGYHVGWIHLYYSTRQAASLRKGMMIDSVVVGISAALCASILVLLFLRRPLLRLRAATGFAERLDREYGRTLDADAGVEDIDALVRALNWTSTRLHEQQSALAQSESRKRAIVESSLDAIISMDGDGRIQEFNEAAERIFGYTREEVLLQPADAFIVPPGLQRSGLKGLQHYLHGQAAGMFGQRFEVSMQRKGGEVFPAELAVVRIPSESEPLYSAFLRDISERKHAEQALVVSETRFRNTVESLSELVFETDALSRWTYLNPAWKTITQYEIDEGLGRSVIDFAPADERPRITAAFKPLFRGETDTLHQEFRYLTKSGGIRWLEVFCRARRDETGRFLAYTGTVTDITARKLSERAMQDQLQFMQSLIDSIPNSIYMKDRSGRYLAFNRACEAFFGIDRNEWINRTVFDLYDDREMAAWHHERDIVLLREGGAQSFETVIRNRRGDMIDTLYQKTLYYHADGSVAGIVGTMTDISERKTAERAILRAKEAAEAASRAKGDFLANMSHEIRTPMNAIIGMTELTLDTRLDDQQREYLQLVRDSADSLLTIINDILDFSKIEAGRMELEQVPFSLRDCVNGTLRMLTRSAQDKNLELESRIDADLPARLIGDPHRLRQVLLNLLSNALKFTEAGGVSVSVDRLHNATDDAGTISLRVAVEDTGIGIPADKQALIFEAFSQADTSTTRRFGGTGLGLAICSRLVDAMGGRLIVVSTPGVGSTFSFLIALQVADGDAPAANLLPDAASAAPTRPLRLLLAEDNPVNQTLALRMLEKLGHTTLVVDNGQLAFDTLRSNEHFDAVLMDVQMPIMGGFEATQAIRQLEQNMQRVRMPIIAMTAHAMSGDRERCMAAGMDGYVTKPISLAALARELGRLTEGRAPLTAPPPLPTTASFNREEVLEQIGGDLDLLHEIARIFLRDGETLIARLRRALAAGDREELAHAAHTARGAVGNFGARTAMAAATTLENACKRASTTPLTPACEKLIAEIENLLHNLREELARADTSPLASRQDA
ncbi:PAS domain S-box protein [Uliginosibacterium sp. H1]|uniref:PAS domain S-box protein n=1 Tax=Uliginosibacterium sp. H1 TaxID=3114757 RepID=UPI002E1844D9|nr:PAS domain S-box protein [Uliginosibacterium sp. H1]